MNKDQISFDESGQVIAAKSVKANKSFEAHLDANGMIRCFDCDGTGKNKLTDDECNMCAGVGMIHNQD